MEVTKPATIEPINIYAKVDLPVSLSLCPLGISAYGRELMWVKLIIIITIMDEMAPRRRTTIR